MEKINTHLVAYCSNWDGLCEDDHCRCNKRTSPEEDALKPNLTNIVYNTHEQRKPNN